MPSRSAGPKADGVRLKLFGNVELLTSSGEPASNILAQTKLLALLVYLVVEEPRGYRRRDRLVGLFWPELDAEHARAALRKALHALRHSLGDAVLDARGDEDVAVPPGALWCDVLAFDEAIEAGLVARAIDLYHGDFLPGYFVRGATACDEWLDQTRTRYQKQAATAAWVLAQRSEEDERLTIAADWAKRAVTLAPFDERVVRKALALLGRAGDRAGAAALYESFRERLTREFEVEPSRETAMLMEQIKAK